MLKARPGELNYGTAGIGSGAHVSTEKFNVAAGVKAVHVPLKGTPPMLAETMAGRIQYAWVPAVSSMGPVKDGKVKPLAVSTPKRIDALPDVPTIAEAAFWVAMLAPAKTPREVVAKINAEVNRALQTPEMKSKLANLGTDAMVMTPEQFDRFVADEYRVLGDIMVKAGLTPQ